MIFQTSADCKILFLPFLFEVGLKLVLLFFLDPCSGPEALLGSFQVEKQQFMRTATIRWSRLPAECENGPRAGYEITVLDSQQTQMYVDH